MIAPEDKVEAIKKQAAKQKKASRIIRVVIIILLSMAVLVCILGLPVLSLIIGPGLFNDTPGYFMFIFLFIAYSAFYIIPFLFCLPVILPLAMRNKNTSRIIVFRKFNDDVSKKALRTLITTILGNYGHVFTLSDKNFKVKWYVRLPFVLGQMTFFHFRPREIRIPKNLVRLNKSLQNKGWLNVNWYLSTSKIFAVKTTDELWQETAKVLLKEADLVIFDVSVFTQSLEWETNITKQLDLEHKIVVVANEVKKQAAMDWKKKYDRLDDDYNIPVHYYNDRSKLESEGRFEEDILSVLANNIATPISYRTRIVKRAVVTCAAVVAVFLVGFLWLAPYILPGLAGRYSPGRDQVFESYLQLKMKTADDDVVQPVIRRIKNKWRLEAAAFSTKRAKKHDPAECRAIEEAMKEFADGSQWSNYVKLLQQAEPAMSLAAYKTIQQLPNYNDKAAMRKLALQLLNANRVDVKEKGLMLLEDKGSDRNTENELLHILSDKTYQVDSMPYQHGSKGGFLQAGRKPDYTADKYYRDLYGHLKNNNANISGNALRQLIAGTPDDGVRFIGSLLLLKKHDATQLNEVINGEAIRKWYRMAIENRGLMSFFDNADYPFAEEIDTVMNDRSVFSNLPTYATVKENKRTWANGYPVPGTIIEFLIRQYTIDALNDVKKYTNVATLSQVLYQHAKNGNGREQQRCLREAWEKRDELLKLLSDSSLKDENKLKVAWLLANVGEMKIIPIVVEASRNTNFLFRWSIRIGAIEVLDLLIERANRSNAIALPPVPADVPDAIRQRVEKIKNKWRS